jgi:hypothetical protein
VKNPHFLRILLILLSLRAIAQPIELNQTCRLPLIIGESSGLEIDSARNFWSHNDSGGNPEIYQFDSTGTLLHTIRIQNQVNIDWEDLTLAPDGRIFIADIGNNNGNRKNLRVLVVHPGVLDNDLILLTANQISFSYTEQLSFPPSPQDHHFDAESIVFFKDSLFLFTKNRSEPFNGKTYIYGMPASPGDYKLSRIGELFIASDPINGRITAADYDPFSDNLVLLSSTGIYQFKVKNNIRQPVYKGFMPFGHISQKEGLCIRDSCVFFVSDELVTGFGGGNLYQGNQCGKTTSIPQFSEANPVIMAFTHKGFMIQFPETFQPIPPEGVLMAWTSDGRMLCNQQFKTTGHLTSLPFEGILPGQMIIVSLISQGKAYRKIIISTDQSD